MKKVNIKIVPLQKEHISQVNRLLYKVFPRDYDNHQTYEQSEEYFRSPNFGTLLWKCWVLLDGGNVIGTTGLYQVRKNKEVWLGWFCVDKNYRGKGLGRKLLTWTIKEAKKRGYKKLKLWTSNAKAEAEAQNLYESVGLKKYRTVKFKKYKTYYRVLDLHKRIKGTEDANTQSI